MELIWIHDLGHAWLKVPMKMINELGIKRKITRYSYKRGHNAYLEEDVDAPTFINAYKEKHGTSVTFNIEEIDHGRESPIRGFERFTIA